MRLLLAVLLFLPTQLLAFEIVFPHFADGVTGETRVVTSLMIVNSDARDTTVSVVFRTGSGTLYTVELFDVETGSFLLRGSELDILVPSRKTVFLKTRGVEPIGSGWAVITVPEGYKVGGTLIFTLSNTRTGEIQTMVGVGSSPGRSTFFMPAFRDSAQRSNTAMALANNSEDSALLQISLEDNSGAYYGTKRIMLGPVHRRAMYLPELFPSLPDPFYGSLHFQRLPAHGEIHALSLIEIAGNLSSNPVMGEVSIVYPVDTPPTPQVPSGDFNDRVSDPEWLVTGVAIPLETGDRYWQFSYIVNSTNRTREEQTHSVKVHFIDADGFTLDYGYAATGETVPAQSTKRFLGTIPIESVRAVNVVGIRLEVSVR